MRVVTVCVLGEPASDGRENRTRIALLKKVVEKITSTKPQWSPDVVLFPGGFFFQSNYLGPKNNSDRQEIIGQSQYSTACIDAASMLNAVIVAGVDGARSYDDEPGDQSCVAWNKRGLCGLARKAWPSKGDNNNGFVVFSKDIDSRSRLASVSRGNKALLCACYDMFACQHESARVDRRSKEIQIISIKGHDRLERQEYRLIVNNEVTPRLEGWKAMVEESTVGLAAIHIFTASGIGSGSSYWQRDGVQNASKAIGGRLAFGAAHFERIPTPVSVKLAAKNWDLLKITSYLHIDAADGTKLALVRLFDV